MFDGLYQLELEKGGSSKAFDRLNLKTRVSRLSEETLTFNYKDGAAEIETSKPPGIQSPGIPARPEVSFRRVDPEL